MSQKNKAHEVNRGACELIPYCSHRVGYIGREIVRWILFSRASLTASSSRCLLIWTLRTFRRVLPISDDTANRSGNARAFVSELASILKLCGSRQSGLEGVKQSSNNEPRIIINKG